MSPTRRRRSSSSPTSQLRPGLPAQRRADVPLMAGQPPTVGTMGRAVGFALIALAIVAVALHRRYDEEPARAPLPPFHPDDAPASELARCQAIGMAAEEDAACKAA